MSKKTLQDETKRREICEALRRGDKVTLSVTLNFSLDRSMLGEDGTIQGYPVEDVPDAIVRKILDAFIGPFVQGKRPFYNGPELQENTEVRIVSDRVGRLY